MFKGRDGLIRYFSRAYEASWGLNKWSAELQRRIFFQRDYVGLAKVQWYLLIAALVLLSAGLAVLVYLTSTA